LLTSILLLVGSVNAQAPICDYCFDVGVKLSDECIAANSAVKEIIARDSGCSRTWDPFCIVEYNDCYNQACGVDNQQLIDDIAETGGPEGRPLDRQQILDSCPQGRLDPTPSPTACPPGKGGKKGGYNGSRTGKGGKKGGDYFGDGARDGKGGKKYNYFADGARDGKGGKKYNYFADGARDGKGGKGGKKGGDYFGRNGKDCYEGRGYTGKKNGGYYTGKKNGSYNYGARFGGKKDGAVETVRVQESVTVGFEVEESFQVEAAFVAQDIPN